jgi:GT2 family glycosyltransferase
MTAPPLSVIIPCHCRADLLRHCLASVSRHLPMGAEVIVVDDAAPGDGVRTVVAEFPAVRLVRLSRRRGYCAAANAGVAAARGPVVELLNDDTEVTAGWADAALACFADPRVAAVAPLVLRWPDATVIDSAGDGYDPGGFARKLGHGEPPGPQRLRQREVFGASGSSAFYRRNMFFRVGAFPEQFGAYFEDVDLAFRLRRAGGTVVYEPASRVLHRGGASYGRPDRRLLEQQSCNEERVFWRNLPDAVVVRVLPRHLAVLAGKAVRRWREGMLLPWACGRFRAWSELIVCRRHERRLAVLGTTRRLEDWRIARLPI